MNPIFIALLFAAALALAASWCVLIQALTIREYKACRRLMEENIRLLEDRHQLMRAVSLEQQKRIVELESHRFALQQFISANARPPDRGDDADAWKRGG